MAIGKILERFIALIGTNPLMGMIVAVDVKMATGVMSNEKR